MSGKEKTQKAVKEEQEAFARLVIERKLTEQLIGNTDWLLSPERVPTQGFDKLHQAAQNYKATIRAIMLAAQEDDALTQKEVRYRNKFSKLMTEVEFLFNQLYEVINAFKLPVKSITGQDCTFRAKRLLRQINYKINAAKVLIETKFGIVLTMVINLQAQDALPQVETSWRMLQEVMYIVSRDLDLTEQLSSKDLLQLNLSRPSLPRLPASVASM